MICKKRLFFVCASLPAFLFATMVSAADVPQTVKTADGRTLKLVWNDEFEGTGLPDPQKWTYEHGFIRNGEAQFYTREREKNAYQKDGRLVIESFREDYEENGQTAKYTSASLITLGKAEWTYGRIEVCAKLPKGRGAWPAIWMLGVNRSVVRWPKCGEIDIMEYVGHNPTQIHATVHAAGKNKHYTSKGSFIRLEGVEDRWTVYALEWSKDKMDFFVDDNLYFTFRKGDREIEPWPFDLPHYLILNTAIGGSWGNAKGIDDSAFPKKFEIDYVRVYQ